MRRLWQDPVSSHHGEFWNLEPSGPTPSRSSRRTHPSTWAARATWRSARVVRLGADWLPFNVTPDQLVERRARLAELLEPTGRPVSDVHITASPNRAAARPEFAAGFAEAGADQLLVHLRTKVTVDTVEAALDELAANYGVSA